MNRLTSVTETGAGTNSSPTAGLHSGTVTFFRPPPPRTRHRAIPSEKRLTVPDAPGFKVSADTPQNKTDFNTANNRLTAAWAGYDLAGNLKSVFTSIR